MTSPSELTIGERLRKARLTHNLSQEALAAAIGTSKMSVSRWEHNQTVPQPYYRERLCQLFHLTTEELFGSLVLQPAVHHPGAPPEDAVVPVDERKDVSLAPPSGEQSRDRERMLRRLHYFYRDLLTQSLRGTSWMKLHLSRKSGAVDNAMTRLLPASETQEQSFPPGTSLLDAYEEAEHALLLLGEPGVGKSTLLLDLALTLVIRAQQDATAPLPFILPLSFWAARRPVLEAWICEQLTIIYDVPHSLSTHWLQTEQILPLLDGLDELEASARRDGIVAINAYHRDHLVPLVVCSRLQEYMDAATLHRLTLHRAVVVHPLTAQQVDDYLLSFPLVDHTEPALHAPLLTTASTSERPEQSVYQMVRENAVVRELATTPLMLNVLLLTASHDPPAFAVARTEKQVLVHLWTMYVKRMIVSKGKPQQYPLQQTTTWLGWLARQMRVHHLTLFSLEHLQPDWLTREQQRRYTWFAVLLPGILLGLLVSLLFKSLFVGTIDKVPLLQGCLIGGFLGGLFTATSFQPNATPQSRWRILWRRLALSALLGAGYAGSFAFQGRTTYRLARDILYHPHEWLRDVSIFGAVMGLCGFILLSLSASFTAPTPQVECQRRSLVARVVQHVHGRRTLIVAIVLGLGTGLSLGVIYALHYGYGIGLSYGMLVGPSYYLFTYGLISLLISVLLSQQREGVLLVERVRWSWRGFWNALLQRYHIRTTLILMLFLMVIIGLSQGMYGVMLMRPEVGVSYGISQGLGRGVTIAMTYWLLAGVFQSIVAEHLDDREHRGPNEGIRRSLRNGFLLASVGSLLIAFMGLIGIGISRWLSFEMSVVVRQMLDHGIGTWRIGLDRALRYGMSSALGTGFALGMGTFWPLVGSSAVLLYLIHGGLAVWRHLVLRLLLWRTQTFPVRSIHFLDDTVARVLLLRINGQYCFLHRELLDYFADQRKDGEGV